jgi:hypothetical protein
LKNRFGGLMETDLKKGIIEINGEVFKPGYTFEEFRKSVFYKGQDEKISFMGALFSIIVYYI